MHAVLQASVSGVYADLVTRPTGRVVRERIEQAIAGRERTGEVTVARMDFTGVGCIDYSCADEIVAKLLRDRRSEEHTSELQSPCNLVCRLLLEKKKK